MSKPLDALAREHTQAALNTLVEISNDYEAKPSDRISAANSILDRGHGKAVSAVIAVPATKQQRAMLAALADADLMNVIEQAPLPRLGAPAPFADHGADYEDPIEADFEVVPPVDPLLG